MSMRKINWDVSKYYTFKPVDALSVLNVRTYTTHSAWQSDTGLEFPTTKYWLHYKLSSANRIGDAPFYYNETFLSQSFNKIIFPSVHPTSFLTQSSDSAVYYLDVYNSNPISIDVQPTDHLNITHNAYADSSNLVFQNSASSTGYSSIALLPSSRAFSIAWCDVTESGAVSASYLPQTYYSTPSVALYGAYTAMVQPTHSLMTIYTESVERFFAIQYDKSALRGGIIPGTLELPLMKNVAKIFFTSSNVYNNEIITLTDYTESIETDINVGQYSYIVSGTLTSKIESDIYGIVYYDIGVLILNGDKLNTELGLDINLETYPPPGFPSSLVPVYEHELNHVKLFNSIQGASYKNSNVPANRLITTSSMFSPSFFKCKVKEDGFANPIYAVVKPHEFNYSATPSWQQRELLPTSDAMIPLRQFCGVWDSTGGGTIPTTGKVRSNLFYVGSAVTQYSLHKTDRLSVDITENLSQIVPNKTRLYIYGDNVSNEGSIRLEYNFLITGLTEYSEYISLNVSLISGSFYSLTSEDITFCFINDPEEPSYEPTSCKSFSELGAGCDEILPLQQKYVHWYYPNKAQHTKIYAAYFIKNELGQCNCEFMGELYKYKQNNRMPHLNYKTFSVKKQFLNNPITYITTIGLYNDTYDLLAIGKLSRPLKKDQFTTYMFKVTLKI